MGPSKDGDLDRDILRLYDCYAAKLRHYATTLVRDEGIAEDAVQEVFLRYSLMLKQGRVISAPKAWLFRVLRNYVLDLTKAAHFKNEIGMDQVPEELDNREDPEQQYASTEMSRRLLSSLTPRELECLRLRAHGLRYNEIAHVLSIRPGTVAAVLSRCNSRIQQLMGGTGQLPAKDPYAS